MNRYPQEHIAWATILTAAVLGGAAGYFASDSLAVGVGTGLSTCSVTSTAFVIYAIAHVA